jgi:acetylornithine/succinyldiaminopimelate/putrescine aminotransferase
MASKTSQEMYEEVKQVESNARTYARRFNITVKKADGVWVWDADGEKYLDALGNAGTAHTGYGFLTIQVHWLLDTTTQSSTKRRSSSSNLVFPTKLWI